MNPEEIKRIKESIEIEAYPWNKGGQNVAVIPKGVRLISNELGIELCIAYSITQHENREIATRLFDQLLTIISEPK